MINFSFNLTWPWFKDDDGSVVDYFFKFWKLSKNKVVEVQISKGGNALIGFDFR